MSTRELWLSAHVPQHEHIPVGCSNSPTFSPTRPWRAERRLVPSKAAANYHHLRGGWDDPNCARSTRAFGGRALREHGDRPSYPAPFSASCYIRSIRMVGTSITRRSTEASPRIRPITLTRSAGTGSCPMLIGVRPKKMARTCPAPQKATSPTLT